MFRKAQLLAVFGLLGSGCLHARIREEAASILQCPEASIRVTEREPRTYEVLGCDRAAICRAPRDDGADIVCAGGAPTH